MAANEQISRKKGDFFIDIAANLTDGMFDGLYNGSQKHQPDLDIVLKRAQAFGVTKCIMLGGSLDDSRRAMQLAESIRLRSFADPVEGSFPELSCTVGVHPTRAGEIFSLKEHGSPDMYIEQLDKLIAQGIQSDTVCAIGEIGLDYDRLQFCDAETQKKGFELQLNLASKHELPIVFHNRNTQGDFGKMIKQHRNHFNMGVVHSFTDSVEEAREHLALDLFIGLNGCSFKTEGNIQAIRSIPLDKTLVETDCPWCDVRPTHAGFKYVKSTWLPSKDKKKYDPSCFVRGRCEPCHVRNIIEMLAGIHNVDVETVARLVYNNTMRIFYRTQYEASNGDPYGALCSKEISSC